MGQDKEININYQTYHFFDNMINIKHFHSNLLKLDKKSNKDINIYYISYITIKKFSDCENIHSVNLLYLIIHSDTGHFQEKINKKYLILDSIEKMEKFCLELDLKSKLLMVKKNCFIKKVMLELELILMMIYL